ncbi:MAG: hypothetical protein NZ699_15825 [Roseiflexus sp.]|nr:hypothetical protein [Roseiflexus sp.]
MFSKRVWREFKFAPLLALMLGVLACSSASGQEILIGLTPSSALLLQNPTQPDPLNTGIPSLDALNKKWRVQRMIPLFPNVPPDDAAAIRHGLAGVYKLEVPPGTNLYVMMREYENDPNVSYAELNKPVEIK